MLLLFDLAEHNRSIKTKIDSNARLSILITNQGHVQPVVVKDLLTRSLIDHAIYFYLGRIGIQHLKSRLTRHGLLGCLGMVEADAFDVWIVWIVEKEGQRGLIVTDSYLQVHTNLLINVMLRRLSLVNFRDVIIATRHDLSQQGLDAIELLLGLHDTFRRIALLAVRIGEVGLQLVDG